MSPYHHKTLIYRHISSRQPADASTAGTSTALLWLMLLLFTPHAQSASSETTAEVRKTQGIFQLQRGNYSQALDYFQQAQQLHPTDPAINYYLGLVLSHEGAYTQAKEHLEIALQDPIVANRARYEIGFADYREQRYPQAAVTFTQVVETDPNHIRAHYYLAISQRQMGIRQPALQHLDTVLQSKSPLKPAAAYLRLGILHELKEYDTVDKESSRYASDYPDSPYQPQVNILRDKSAAAADRDRRWNLRLTSGLSYDTNVTVQPDETEADNPSKIDKEDSRLALSADGRYHLYRQGPHRSRAGLKLNTTHHSHASDYDTRRIGLVADHLYYQKGLFLGVEYNIAQSWLGGREYTKSQSLSPYYSFKPAITQSSLIQYSYSQNDYLPAVAQDERDSTNHYLAYRHTFKGEKQIGYASLHLLRSDAYDSEYSYQGGGVGATLQFAWGQQKISLGLKLSQKQYPQNQLDRKEDNLGLTLNASRKINKRLSLEGLISHSDNNANITQYTYQRQIMSILLKWSL
ncbi:MAG: tetratricopeptide repeat protein [Gammaproteobacteria bacterium]|nr:tetratricopeptide repeat protein [Gammaproteobacteria bacterium]